MKKRYWFVAIVSLFVGVGIVFYVMTKADAQVLGDKGKEVNGNTHKYGGFQYSSTIDDIDDLYARYEYKESNEKLPLVVLMHGYVEQVSDIEEEVFTRYADQGVFVLAVGMRGRDSADGKQDASARELYDIYDAVEYVKKEFPDVIDETNINFVGYSGGGGNGLGLAVKYPDLFDNVVTHFAISDYGYGEKTGWWQQDTYPRDRIEDYIGGTPEEVKDAYYSRAHLLGVGNYRNGYLYMYADEMDESVSVNQTTVIEEELKRHNLNNYSVDITDENDDIRWLHSLPQPDQPVINTEKLFMPSIISHKHENSGLDQSGKLVVMGYLVSEDFEIWLGDGTEEVAELEYNLVEDSFRLSPKTGNMKVRIDMDGKIKEQEISSETLISY